jgi:hypothetical protein
MYEMHPALFLKTGYYTRLGRQLHRGYKAKKHDRADETIGDMRPRTRRPNSTLVEY